ncbi:MAG: metallophosphoesterase, partial [Myxococcales bacterium]|nr:metallophosphoesterase [Myxococcales bacterium]
MQIRHTIVAKALALSLATGGAAALPACDSDSGSTAVDETPITLTDQTSWAATRARSAAAESRDPRDPADRAGLLADGFGDQTQNAGEAHIPVVIGDTTAPDPGPTAHLVTRFVHFADLQLADDESPARVAAIDGPGLTASSYRPQDAWMCLMVDAMVREFNALNASLGLDFIILGGDNADNAQKNELAWVLQLLGPGGTMSCDSGADDDPVPGPHNDPKDPFDAAGLDVPYLWVTGNHDVLIQGNLPVSAELNDVAVGTRTNQGTRDWSQPGGPVVNDVDLPADARRALN